MRIGIVGAGSMARAHAPGWIAAGAELVGIVAKHRSSAAVLAEQFGTRVFDSYKDLLTAVDVIDLCVPTDLHKTMTMQAAAARKHVICEKPLALTIKDGQAMIDACKEAGVRLFIAMVLRFFPQYQAAQKAVVAGQIGDLGVLRLKRVSYQPSGDDAWFANEARSGGLLLDLMVHDFDYASWLAGKVERVFAKSVRSKKPNAQGDYALVTLRFKNGCMALIEGGWAYPLGVFRTAFDIAGRKGLIEWNSDSTETIHPFLESTSPEVARVGLPLTVLSEDPYTSEIKHAFDAIKNNKPFAVTPQDALEAVRIALAARDSLKTGKPVYVEGGD